MLNKRYEQLKAAEGGAIISLTAYSLITIMKLLVGNIGHSEALIADGFNNSTDILASLTVLIGLHFSRRPPDKNHQYGHWKSENIASMITSIILLIVALQVLFSAFRNILSGQIVTPSPLSAIVGIISAILLSFLYFHNQKLAKNVHSTALLAAAKDNLSDIFTSIATTLAILASSFHFSWLDATVAIIISLLILNMAVDIFKNSVFMLSDGFDQHTLDQYRLTVNRIPGVIAVKEIRGRSYSENIALDIVVTMNPQLTAAESHAITKLIEKKLFEAYQIFDVEIHVEPENK
ncbi:cation diffusion facilitator family transporter [Leuconostoc mesenteroides]|uniref:cation diffusion facilitator family transporter n=1 Tax=Leuconostoc mesenteroides TaxID=1245 RepID=UPI0006800C36|nr:cation diffusion facilitator family transporter [Leuconostoc mesenteroides]KMY78060.1 transporter [Leuconostoc mesenteroides subsp. mesenteroides]